MKRLAIVGAALVLALSAQGGGAQDKEAAGVFANGNYLLNECEQPTAYCYGFVAAVADMLSSGKVEGFTLCLSRDTHLRQLKDAVTQALQSMPTMRTSPAIYLTVATLSTGWPCPK